MGNSQDTIRKNNCVYVDVKFGSDDTGKIGYITRPFKSIMKAIEIIGICNEPWKIIIAPGIYKEIVNISSLIYLEGAGINLTWIRSLYIYNSTYISNLSIGGSEGYSLPILKSSLNTSTINHVIFDRVEIKSDLIFTDLLEYPIIEFEGSGLNNSVTLRQCHIYITNHNNSPRQNMGKINSICHLIDTDINYTVDNTSVSSLWEIGSFGKLYINGGKMELQVKDAPQYPVTLFDINQGYMTIINNISCILCYSIKDQYKSDISYIQNNGGIIEINSTILKMESIFKPYAQLINNLNSSGKIELNNLIISGRSCPKITGSLHNIKYNIVSQDNNIISNGGYYANIIHVDPKLYPEKYYVQENDYTILSHGINIYLFDPVDASKFVLDKGKIIIIKNIHSTKSITIFADNDSIFNSQYVVVESNKSIIFQNDGFKWYHL
jgi:hypothetical protein